MRNEYGATDRRPIQFQALETNKFANWLTKKSKGRIPTNPYASNPASCCFSSISSDNADAGHEEILLVLYSMRINDESLLPPLYREPFPYGRRMRPSTAAKMSSFRIKPGISNPEVGREASRHGVFLLSFGPFCFVNLHS